METGPSMEAVQELQAQTSGLDAATAITNGGVMSFTLKSGTNKFPRLSVWLWPQRTFGCEYLD